MANQLQKAAQGHDTEAELKMAATLMAAFPDPRQSEGLYPALMQVRTAFPGLEGWM